MGDELDNRKTIKHNNWVDYSNSDVMGDEERYSKKPKFDDMNKFLPNGWLDCPNFGQEIDFIFPSKVPLDHTYNHCIPLDKRYSVYDFKKLRENGVEIGMVVDLTNTGRYYSPSEFKKAGIRYLKVRCQGRDSVPDNQSVNTFVFEVGQFISKQIYDRRPQKRVLVHCTHGHNRTGYMIVHYLMRTQKVASVTEAIQRFAKSRPPGIYKPYYIDSLYAFYHEIKPLSLLCPSVPLWKDDDEDGGVREKHDNGVVVARTMSNDDVLGDKIPEEQEYQLRRLCLEMLRLPVGNTKQFPGSHPVSLDRENMQLLRKSYYYATWKADGTRYMLLLSSDGCFLIDRRFNFRRVQMRFPCRNNTNVSHHFTLLDGEMVIDTVSDTGKQERRFLIYDMMVINGVSIVDRPFHERFKLIQTDVVEPRNNDRCRPENVYRYDREAFRVRRKDFWQLWTVEKLLKKLIPRLSHKADGLIFQGWDDCYVPGAHEGLMKWKYPEMNSVDFLFEVVGKEYQLYLTGKTKPSMGNNKVVFGKGFDQPMSYYSGKIIECSWDFVQNVWVCLRVRVDKPTPNGFKTYKNVMKSIKDNITDEVLLNEIDDIICLPMYTQQIRTDIAEAKRN